jgi:serine/threonine-protein kinase
MEADDDASFATAAGRSVGTLNYMSPEQSTASDVDGRSDLFSLGCTMYHLLTGQVPFPGETIAECLKRRTSGNPVPITDLRPDTPAELVGVMNKLMAHRPEDRFQTATDAALALQAAPHSADADPRRTHRRMRLPVTRPSVPESDGAVDADAGTRRSPPRATSRRWRTLPSHLRAALGAWPPAGASLRLMIVASLAFLVGFALGQASAIMLLRGGK